MAKRVAVIADQVRHAVARLLAFAEWVGLHCPVVLKIWDGLRNGLEWIIWR